MKQRVFGFLFVIRPVFDAVAIPQAVCAIAVASRGRAVVAEESGLFGGLYADE
jgi:hypothetical protein